MLLEVKDLTKRYQRGAVQVDALAGVSFAADRGEFVAITGPSGSGKTTLLLAIGGLIRSTSGSIRFAGRSLHEASPAELARYRTKDVGFVMQSFALIPYLTALENVMVPLGLDGVPPAGRAARAREVLAEVGLADRTEHLPRELSAGQQQRVAIARAIVNGPAMLLADEPTGNLDPDLARDTLDLLQGLVRDHDLGVVMVTHSPEAAARGTRRVHLVAGRIAEPSPARALPRSSLTP